MPVFPISIIPPVHHTHSFIYDGWYTILAISKAKHFPYRPELALRVDRGTALPFLDLGARRGWVVSTMPRLLYPQ
jgi:hypothetical protein